MQAEGLARFEPLENPEAYSFLQPCNVPKVIREKLRMFESRIKSVNHNYAKDPQTARAAYI